MGVFLLKKDLVILCTLNQGKADVRVRVRVGSVLIVSRPTLEPANGLGKKIVKMYAEFDSKSFFFIDKNRNMSQIGLE